MKFAIVLIHKGNSWYLPYTLFQLKQFNPNTPIYFIGSQETKHFEKCGWVHHIDIDKYTHSGNTLRNVYKHHSGHGVEFELFCIERWFILNDFLKEKGIEKSVYLDSDILVYSNLHKERMEFDGDMTWEGFSAHTNFINDNKILNTFCEFIVDIYQNGLSGNNQYDTTQFYKRMNKIEEGFISDMTMFADFDCLHAGHLLNIALPYKGKVFDITLDETSLFLEEESGYKKLQWFNNMPFATTKKGEQIKMNTLHFQGKAKSKLKSHFKLSSFKFLRNKVLNDILILNNRLKNKFFAKS